MAKIYTDEPMWHHPCIGRDNVLPWRILAINMILDNVLGEQELKEVKLDSFSRLNVLRSTCEP